MTMTATDRDKELAEKYYITVSEVVTRRKEARERCERWNWNANLAEIARELINADVDPDDIAGELQREELLAFFCTTEKERDEYNNYWSIISDIIAEFG